MTCLSNLIVHYTPCYPLAQISTFLQHLCQLYRRRNTYHNFQHALDVFQATYFFLYTAGMIPPVSLLLHADARLWQPDKRTASGAKSFLDCLENEDIFALYIAAVGHDVGHPGLTNTFLVCFLVHSTVFARSFSLYSGMLRHLLQRHSKNLRSSKCTPALSYSSCATMAWAISLTVPSPARASRSCSR